MLMLSLNGFILPSGGQTKKTFQVKNMSCLKKNGKHGISPDVLHFRLQKVISVTEGVLGGEEFNLPGGCSQTIS